MKVRGGASGKKAKYERTYDFSVLPADPPTIRIALQFKHPELKAYWDSLSFNKAKELYEFILEQRNSDRVINKICSQIPEWIAVQD